MQTVDWVDQRDIPGQHRNILDSLPVGVALIQSDMIVVEWNRTIAEWSGISRSKAVGIRLSDFFPNLEEPRYKERLEEVFRSAAPAIFSASFHKHFLPMPAPHGLKERLMTQQSEVRPVFGGVLALITIQDVSVQFAQLNELKRQSRELAATRDELKRSNNSLLKAVTELEHFSFATSHDLQEPLRTIAGFSDILRLELALPLDSKHAKMLRKVTKASERMSKLIQSAMSYSGLRKSGLRMESVDLNECVSRAIEKLAGQVSVANASIRCDALPAISGDHALLTSVFENIICNSLKFVRNNVVPEISISSRTDEAGWEISFSDNGIGVPSQFHDLIFRPFKRLHAYSTYPGAGLGLSICKEIIELHGGSIAMKDSTAGGLEIVISFKRLSEN